MMQLYKAVRICCDVHTKPVAYDLLVAVTFTIAQTVASTPYQSRKENIFFALPQTSV